MGAWVIGHNLAGYLPEADTYAFEPRDDAAEALADDMREYASTDDEHAWCLLPSNPAEAERQGYSVNGAGAAARIDYGDDTPSMRAHVEAVLRDDGPDTPAVVNGDWGAIVEDGSGRRISFWLMWSDDRDPDEEY